MEKKYEAHRELTEDEVSNLGKTLKAMKKNSKEKKNTIEDFGYDIAPDSVTIWAEQASTSAQSPGGFIGSIRGALNETTEKGLFPKQKREKH